MASNDVIVRLVADVSSLQAGMDKATKELEGLKSATEKSTSSMGNAFKKIGTVVAGALAVDKVVTFGKECLSLGAYLEEMENKFNVVFSKTGKAVDKWAGDFAKAIGRSKTEIKDGVANLGDLLIGYGMTEEVAGDLSQQVIELSYDLASFNNVQDADAIDRMTKGILGEHEGLKALGIAINESTIKEKLHQEGIKKKWQEMNEAEKAQIRYKIMLDQTKNAQGDAVRSIDSYTNRQKVLDSTLNTIKETIGGMLIPVMTDLTNMFIVVAEKVLSFVEVVKTAYEETGSFGEALARAFESIGLDWAGNLVLGVQSIIDIFKEVIGWFKEHELASQILTGVVGGLAFAFGGLKLAMAISDTITSMNNGLKVSTKNMQNITKKINLASKNFSLATLKAGLWNTVSTVGTAVTTAFGTAMAFLTSPITLVVLAIAGLIAVGYLLIKNWDSVKVFLIAMWEVIKVVASSIWNGIKVVISATLYVIKTIIITVWESIKFVIETILTIILKIVSTIWNSIYTVIKPILDIIKTVIITVWQGIQLAIAVILTIILGIVKVVWEGIKVVINTVLNVILTIVKAVWGVISTVIQTILNVILGIISSVWNVIKTVIENVLNVIKSVVSTVWGGISSVISTVIEKIKSLVSTGFTWVKDKAVGIFNGLKTVVLGIWNGIGKGIQGVVNGIIFVINGMVRAMNKINFTVPDWIPGMGGKSFGFNVPEVPKVSWFATGGIIKGTQDGTIVGVGENGGDEAIVPLSNKSRMKPFAQAVSDLMPDKTSEESEGSGSKEQVTLVIPLEINGKEFTKLVIQDIDAELSRRRKITSRFKGGNKLGNI